MRSKSILGTLLVTSALGLSLTACREDERNLAAADMAWPATLAAPYPGPLEDRYGPPPQRIPVGRLASYDDGWAWAERSYALDRAFYDTPPDYGFYYDDYEPWVWQTDDRWAMYGDPYAEDDWRYYYYRPGAVRPYFIRDDHYGYGFDEAGRLVAMFDLLGRLLAQDDLYRYEDAASGYYQRAYLIRQASLRAQPVVITREVWLEEAPIIQRTTNIWITAAQQQPEWVRYRQRTGDRFVRAFDDERRRRETVLTAARAEPDRQQRRGFFGRPAGEPRDQLASATPDRRGVFDRLAGKDRSANRDVARAERAAKPDRRGVFSAGPSAEREVRQGKARKNDDQRAFVRQDRRQAEAGDPQRLVEDRRGKQREAQQQRQGEDRGRKQREAQQQNAQRQQAEDRRQQQAQQRQAEDRGRKQREAQQQHEQRRQAQAQAREQEQAQQRLAEDRGRKQREAQQQHDQRQQAEAQARQQQQAQQQRQAEDRGRKQREAQQQHEQQRQQAEAQARQQQAQQQAQKQRGQKQEAQAAEPGSQGQGKGGGHGKKG